MQTSYQSRQRPDQRTDERCRSGAHRTTAPFCPMGKPWGRLPRKFAIQPRVTRTELEPHTFRKDGKPWPHRLHPGYRMLIRDVGISIAADVRPKSVQLVPAERSMILTKILSYFQRYIVFGLMVLMMVVILFSAVELGIMIVTELMRAPSMQFGVRGALELFGFFFMILIGLELMHTIELYLKEEQLHVEIVFLVAMIAVSRKVIILDYKATPAFALIGIAAIILALAGGYYLVRRTAKPGKSARLPEGKK